MVSLIFSVWVGWLLVKASVNTSTIVGVCGLILILIVRAIATAKIPLLWNIIAYAVFVWLLTKLFIIGYRKWRLGKNTAHHSIDGK